MRRLAMGYTGSPQLAQATSVTLAGAAASGVDHITWVDNVLSASTSAALLQRAAESFRALCGRYRVIIGDTTPIRSRGEFLGMELDLRDKCWRLAPAWVEKVRDAARELDMEGHLPMRLWWRLCGCLVWRAHVLKLRLAHLTTILRWMSDTARAGRAEAGEMTGGFWDAPALLPIECRQVMRTELATLELNEWQMWQPPLTRQVAVFSDASSSGWGCVVDNHGFYGPFPPDVAGLPIYHKELHAAARLAGFCVRWLETPCHIVLFIDNTAVVQGVNAGYSLDGWAGKVIGQIVSTLSNAGCSFAARYVHTSLNPADRFSRFPRGEMGCRVPLRSTVPTDPSEVQTLPPTGGAPTACGDQRKRKSGTLLGSFATKSRRNQGNRTTEAAGLTPQGLITECALTIVRELFSHSYCRVVLH